jgi:tetratricopeptide (TPR) repeat protein
MKNIIMVFLAFSVSTSFAFTIDEATTAYNKRAVSAEGFESARLAAKLGIEIGNDGSNSPDISARGFLVACKAKFFLGDYLPVSRTDKKVEYKTSSEYCLKGISLVELTKGTAKKEEWKNLLGDLYFNYTSSFGRWFEDESKFRALGYWKDDVKPILEILDEKMGLSEIYGQGPLRALGRAYFSIPGGRGKAVKFLKDAYDKSLHSTLGVSVYPLTTAYYAEALVAKGDKEEARAILEKTLEVADSGKLEELHNEAYKIYGEYRWAETVEEINLCREIYNGLI